MFWVWLLIGIWVASLGASLLGVWVEAEKDCDCIDEDLVAMSFIPIFNFFFGWYGIYLFIVDIKERYEHLNEILECPSCEILSRRGHTINAGANNGGHACPHCGSTRSFRYTGHNHSIKIDDSPKISIFDMSDIEKGKHNDARNNIQRRQEEKIRALRKNQEHED